MNRIYIVALHTQGKIQPETYEAVSFAENLGPANKTIIVLGSNRQVQNLAPEIAEHTGIDVTGITAEYMEHYCAETYKEALKKLLEREAEPFAICVPHTAMGYDFAPCLATALNASCITAITGVHEDSFSRYMFGGKICAYVKPLASKAVLTVSPGAWKPCAATSGNPGRVNIFAADTSPVSTRTKGLKASSSKDIGFADAEVIVSAGRGIGGPQNLLLIKNLSAMFTKSAIGATRAVCDLGWLGYSHQIGSTGKSVSPKVYIACGISGAVQHVNGMKNSQIIIAINSDPHAAIYRWANFCIVEDVKTFIPILIAEYMRRLSIQKD